MKSNSKSLSLLPAAPKSTAGSSKTRGISSSEPILLSSSPVSLKSSSASLQTSQRRRVNNMQGTSGTLSNNTRHDEKSLARGRELRKQMLNAFIGLRDDLRRLNRNVRHFSREYRAGYSNEIARHMNSFVRNPDTELEPLRGMNNKYIENFPKTIREVLSLNSASVNAILIALKVPTTGDLEQRRRTALRRMGVFKIVEV